MTRLVPGLLLCGVAALWLAGVPTPRPPTAAAPVPPSPWPVVERAAHKGYREALPKSKVAFDLAAVPGGTFLRGSPAVEKGRRDDEAPRHPVRVGPFWMATTEVTWDLYDLFRGVGEGAKAFARDNEVLAEDADALTCPSPTYPDETRGFGREGYPAIGISHHAAMEFCRWLSRVTGKAYRLPTEAEWEWACRAGTSTAYHFGDDAAKLGDHAWYDANSGESTHPVGKKKPNPWGLFDMHGNVAEWCLDHYRKDAYAGFPRRTPTLGPVLLPTAARFSHIVRGGSWADPAKSLRSAARRGSEPSWNRIDPAKPKSLWWLWDADFVGFRVVRAVAEQANLKGLRSKVTKESK
jgi:formylglycine-generating enzyme required for sulfatase activity